MDALLESAASIAQALASPSPREPEQAAASAGTGFAELVEGVIQSANREQVHAEEQARAIADGKGDIVEAMIAASRADLSLRFVVSLRNRAIEAYQEIMRLQV